jgi:hypothetical protein
MASEFLIHNRSCQRETIVDQIHMRFAIKRGKALIENSKLSISNYNYLAMRKRLKIKGISITATVVNMRANVIEHGFDTAQVVF